MNTNILNNSYVKMKTGLKAILNDTTFGNTFDKLVYFIIKK